MNRRVQRKISITETKRRISVVDTGSRGQGPAPYPSKNQSNLRWPPHDTHTGRASVTRASTTQLLQ